MMRVQLEKYLLLLDYNNLKIIASWYIYEDFNEFYMNIYKDVVKNTNVCKIHFHCRRDSQIPANAVKFSLIKYIFVDV